MTEGERERNTISEPKDIKLLLVGKTLAEKMGMQKKQRKGFSLKVRFGEKYWVFSKQKKHRTGRIIGH